MNSAALGGLVRGELMKAAVAGAVDSADLCVGGCRPWQKSEKGRGLYRELEVRFRAAERNTT